MILLNNLLNKNCCLQFNAVVSLHRSETVTKQETVCLNWIALEKSKLGQ